MTQTLKLAEAGAGLTNSTLSGPTVHTHNHSTGCDDTAAFMGLTAQQAQHLRLDTQRASDKLVLRACRLPHRLDHPIFVAFKFLSLNHSVIFEIALKHTISDSFTDYDGYSISSKVFLLTVIDIMVI